MTKTKTKKRALQDRLGAVLEPSWVDLGMLWASKKWSPPRAGAIFLKNHVFQQMRRQEAIWSRSWVDLRGQEAPKVPQELHNTAPRGPGGETPPVVVVEKWRDKREEKSKERREKQEDRRAE